MNLPPINTGRKKFSIDGSLFTAREMSAIVAATYFRMRYGDDHIENDDYNDFAEDYASWCQLRNDLNRYDEIENNSNPYPDEELLIFSVLYDAVDGAITRYDEITQTKIKEEKNVCN